MTDTLRPPAEENQKRKKREWRKTRGYGKRHGSHFTYARQQEQARYTRKKKGKGTMDLAAIVGETVTLSDCLAGSKEGLQIAHKGKTRKRGK